MAVYQDGTLVVWRRQSGSVSWLAPILHSVDANIRNASISSNHDQIALLLFDTNELRWMLLRWTLDSDDLVEVALPVQAGNDTVAQITALGHDLVLAMPGRQSWKLGMVRRMQAVGISNPQSGGERE